MLIAVDIGNSHIVVAVHSGKEWIHSFRIHSDQKKTTDEYFVVLEALMNNAKISRQDITKAVISSVVPNLTRAIAKNIYNLFSIQPLMVSHSVNTNLIRETIPKELGMDLLANVAQAHYVHPDRCVMVIDFGTALTFSTVNGEGAVLGVSIAPGLVTAVNSLFGATAQLPQVELKTPPSVIGRTSQDSINAGIMFGYAGLVKSIIELTEAEIGEELYVIATGGLSRTLSPLVGRINQIAPMHTLDGLKLISDLN
ncbi:MAG TPA: type III pantothenate kinase [Sphaerochaeta sp.]|nr:type III pantothenate kinase [Spirochaetota bacterium]TAH57631.1 MAG: type III pantothenate kinase [Sphaerochaeta sp.]HOE89400.1 type III pantothenate kinase [Sphaerochaeta sp.]HOR80801.1 type III pantothenate kinase [Sphaerochaeta sp.]HPK64604.1 type III pantothenate kinase [Sphaerochaeta sp.]